MLGKLLGKASKKAKYYLELTEDEIAAIREPSETPAPESPKAKAATTAKAASAKGKAPEAKGKAPEATDKAPAAAPQEVAVPQPMVDSVEIIRSAIAAAAKQAESAEASSAATFDYTTPVAKARRRRPGPSMSPFKTMVKTMKRTPSGF